MEHCKEHTDCMVQMKANTESTKRNKEDIVTIFELMEKIRSRLPNYATVIFAILTLIIGWLLQYVR